MLYDWMIDTGEREQTSRELKRLTLVAAAVLTSLIGAGSFASGQQSPTEAKPTPSQLSEYAKKTRLRRPELSSAGQTQKNDGKERSSAANPSSSNTPGQGVDGDTSVDVVAPEELPKLSREQWFRLLREQEDTLRLAEADLKAQESRISDLWDRFYEEDDRELRETHIRAELERGFNERASLEKLLTEKKARYQRTQEMAQRVGAAPRVLLNNERGG
ncbi:MAG: hypothetical protein GY906_12445 [bacterium]|nr:hypothetical protein [bacterium]